MTFPPEASRPQVTILRRYNPRARVGIHRWNTNENCNDGFGRSGRLLRREAGARRLQLELHRARRASRRDARARPHHRERSSRRYPRPHGPCHRRSRVARDRRSGHPFGEAVGYGGCDPADQAAPQARHRGALAAKRRDQGRHPAPRAGRCAGDGRRVLRRHDDCAPRRDPPDGSDAARRDRRIRRQDLRARAFPSRSAGQIRRELGALRRRAARQPARGRVALRRRGAARRGRGRSDAGEPRRVGHPRALRRGRKARVREPQLTLRAIRARGVDAPLKLPLGTSAGMLRSAPLLLIDLETEEGITGHSYLFCYLNAVVPAIATVLGEVERSVRGDRIAPADLWAKLARRFKLIGVQGIVRMAMAGLDVACWDALALAAGKPLVALLGGKGRPIPAYNSNGLGLMAPAAAADEAEKLLEKGFRAVKLRLGNTTLEADL